MLLPFALGAGLEPDTFLASLSQDDLGALRARARRRLFPRGATITVEGTIPHHMLFVVSGHAKVSRYTDDGREVVLFLLAPGEPLDETAAIDQQPSQVTITAIDDVHVFMVEATDFRSLLETRPRLAHAFLQAMGRRVRDAYADRVDIAVNDTIGRVAGRLVELSERYGEHGEGKIRITLSLSQQELASWAGASREAVSRALQTLRQRSWIEVQRRGITILDEQALRQRADAHRVA